MERRLKTPAWQAVNHLHRTKERAESPRQPCRSCPTNTPRDILSFRWYGGGQLRKQCIYCRVSACYQGAAHRYRSPFSESDKGKLENTLLQVYDKWERWMRAKAFDVQESREDVLVEMRNRHSALVRSHEIPARSGCVDQPMVDLRTCRDCKTISHPCYHVPLAKIKDVDSTTNCIRCRIRNSVKKKKLALEKKRFESKKAHEEAWQHFRQTPGNLFNQWKEIVGSIKPEVSSHLVNLIATFVTNMEDSLRRQVPRWYPENTPLPERSSPPSPPQSTNTNSSDLDTSSDYSEAEEDASTGRAKRIANEPPTVEQRFKRQRTNQPKIVLLSPPPSSECGNPDSSLPRNRPDAIRIVLPEAPRPHEIQESDCDSIMCGTRQNDERSPKATLEELYAHNKECLTSMLASLSKLKELELDFSESILRRSLDTWKAHASKFKKAVLVATREQEIENDKRKMALWFSDPRTSMDEVEED